MGWFTSESVVVDSPTMLVQVENLQEYDGADAGVDRDMEALEDEEMQERDDFCAMMERMRRHPFVTLKMASKKMCLMMYLMRM